MPRKLTIFAIAVACAAIVLFQVLSRPQVDGSGLQYVAIGIDEDHSPVVLGIKVQNSTGDEIQVTDCSAQLLYNSLVAGDFTPDNMPASFSPEVTFLDATPIVIPANSTAVVQLTFDWKLDDSAPPAAAACQVIPVLQTKTDTIVTEPVAFVVTHKSEAVKEAEDSE